MDIIADSLTKIRNAGMRKLPKTTVKKTRVVQDMLKIMVREGFLVSYKDAQPYTIEVELKYLNDKCVIDGLQRVSRQSRRIYVGRDNLPSVFNNYGVAILTTSKGVVTDKEARSLGVGGEVLCYVW